MKITDAIVYDDEGIALFPYLYFHAFWEKDDDDADKIIREMGIDWECVWLEYYSGHVYDDDGFELHNYYCEDTIWARDAEKAQEIGREMGVHWVSEIPRTGEGWKSDNPRYEYVPYSDDDQMWRDECNKFNELFSYLHSVVRAVSYDPASDMVATTNEPGTTMHVVTEETP